MLELATAADIPPGPSAAGQEWLLAQSIQTLGQIGSVGKDNAVFQLMIKTVADSKLSFSTRTIAAQSLGMLNYAGATGINVVDAVADLGQFAANACADELQSVKDTGLTVSRRRMKQRLAHAHGA